MIGFFVLMEASCLAVICIYSILFKGFGPYSPRFIPSAIVVALLFFLATLLISFEV